MKQAVNWVWKRGIVSTFVTGLFVVLPIMITVAIIGWVSGLVIEWLGPGSLFGKVLTMIGLQVFQDETRETVGTLAGWAIVLVGIWGIGLLARTLARQRIAASFNGLINRIPIIGTVYRPVSQVVDMLKRDDENEMSGMSVVFCTFGEAHGGGFLALLASGDTFRFAERDCHAVYIPTSPVPMSGGIVFVPVEKVQTVEMSVDELMQIYFSLGVMASKVVPQQYRVA